MTSKQHKGYEFEKKVAADIGGKTNRFGPDVRATKFLIECKVRGSKGAKSITILKEWLDKVITQARKEGRIGGVAFKFAGDRHYYLIFPQEVISEDVFRLESSSDSEGLLQSDKPGSES